jgi:hypothetical protein
MTTEIAFVDADDAEIVVAPGKAVRLADMIDRMVEELHTAALDDDARIRFLALYKATLIEVGSTLSDALLTELARVQTVSVEDCASCDELRVAMTQLAGWLHGVILGVLTGTTVFNVSEGEPFTG